MPILTCWMNVFKFKNLQTCVSKSSFFDVFCVTPIVPESFMIVSSTNVLVKLFLMVGGFGGRSYDHSHCPKCISLVCRAWTPCLSAGTTDGCSWLSRNWDQPEVLQCPASFARSTNSRYLYACKSCEHFICCTYNTENHFTK